MRALHGCLEPEKELDLTNTSIAVVGVGERFHVLEGGEAAPFLAGLGPAGPQAPAGEEEEAKAGDEGPGAGAAAAGAGAGDMGDVQ